MNDISSCTLKTAANERAPTTESITTWSIAASKADAASSNSWWRAALAFNFFAHENNFPTFSQTYENEAHFPNNKTAFLTRPLEQLWNICYSRCRKKIRASHSGSCIRTTISLSSHVSDNSVTIPTFDYIFIGARFVNRRIRTISTSTTAKAIGIAKLDGIWPKAEKFWKSGRPSDSRIIESFTNKSAMLTAIETSPPMTPKR